jgi:A/G-specific adenine glycosylase
MLQQTQVATAIPYYINFLNRFPDLQTLARASESEVLELWSGLGYYSRARNLLKTATTILDTYGEFPGIFHILITFPGIGKYTAGAICAIAFNQPEPAVDGNIKRVLTRLNAIQGGTSEGYFRNQMKEMLPEGKAAEFTQAMMELGALICTPSDPKCSICPVAQSCAALKRGIQSSIPEPRSKQAIKTLEISVFLLEQDGKFLIVSPVEPKIIPGKWGFPCVAIPCSKSSEATTDGLCKYFIGANPELRRYARFFHTITNHKICVHAYYGKSEYAIAADDTRDYLWASGHQLKKHLVSSLFKKVLDKYAALKKKGL